ncbi:hypothetical protein B0H10DRAFT_2229471 [Mycena sp. CBHHK59/15]|nr:hypothetical protein B0H10DRAFT_2229471 [Mycena sp. CBHHK59/15]
MSNTFAARFGPAPFSELVSEIQHRYHADGELMYLSAADFYGRTNVQSFSAFDDPQGYAGSPPSVPYLKALFTDNVSAYRIFIERFIASLPLTVAAGDHTFQLLKYMGDLKGEQIFIAAYTLLNEFEEVRAHSLTQTKSLAFVKELFERIQEGLKNANHPPTEIFYTDSPQLERSFHESINSSLIKDVEPITEWTDLPTFEPSSGIPTTIVSDSMEIEDEANDILVDIVTPTTPLSLVALAIKTQQRKDGPPRLEIIQLRTQDKIVVFEVAALTSRSEILPSLRAILTNPTIIKIGHSIRENLQIISDAFSLPEIATLAKAKNAPILDLGKYAKLKAVVDDPSVSLSALSGLVLRKSFSFPYHLSYPWSLTPAEQNTLLFREIDCQWQIYLALSHLDSLGLPLQPTQSVTHGQRVTLIQACKPVAEGSIVGHHPGYLDTIMDEHGLTKRINVSASRSLIEISKVLVPGSLHKLHNQTLEWIFAHGGQAVVSTSQLISRGETAPVPARIVSRVFSVPAPPDNSQHIPEFTPSISPSIEFENLTEKDMEDTFACEDSDQDDDDFDFDFDEDTEFEGNPVLVSGALHSLHGQTMEWIFTHGAHAVVTTSQLHTRNETAPLSGGSLRIFAVPMPPTPSSDDETNFSTTYMSSNERSINFEHWNSSTKDLEDDSDESDDESESEDDIYSRQVVFETSSDAMQGIETDPLGSYGDENNVPEDVLMANLDNTFELLRQSEILPSRVLDDAFHYMDRLLRLLSKKHSAFKAFAHDFSEAIFIRDKSDTLAVRAVLEKNNVSWEYAKRAKGDALNRRIRRYIRERTILLKRLEKLFTAYADIECTVKKSRGAFFSDEAKEMVVHLLDTVRKGYLSDPNGISLYYLMGKDRDGLNLYRTVRGTNSVEGGFHMAVRRIFGSLRASPELAECLMLNWILRRNKRVGFHNRTGEKFRGHFDIWIQDYIVELAVAAGIKTSFPLPRMLSTRIVTSETIGILPISKTLAGHLNITTLPTPRITGIPHHRDTPVRTMTRLSTKPTNPYQYLQLRQRVLTPVVPVHTHQEYITFKSNINRQDFRTGGKTYPPHERWKNVDFEKFAQWWNAQVNFHPRTITDSNLRLYYKLPQHLEAHHKKTISWSSERSTLAAGANFAARKEFLEILNSDDNLGDVLPAISFAAVPDGEQDVSFSSFAVPMSFDLNHIKTSTVTLQFHLDPMNYHLRWTLTRTLLPQVLSNQPLRHCTNNCFCPELPYQPPQHPNLRNGVPCA